MIHGGAALEAASASEEAVAMRFGVIMFPTEYSMGVVELGRTLEGLGFESLWLPEHTHIPTSRRSPWPGGPVLPEEYRHAFDPFLSLSAVASVTTSLLLGTGVCLVVERDPITLAKEVATLDQLSNGRFLFGIGGGWNEEEMAHHGTDPSRRWALVRERVAAMKEIWTHDVAEFHGELVDFDPIWQWPKPVQKPHPPILIGGHGPRVVRRVVAYADGWMPILNRIPDLESRLDEYRRLTAEAGRGELPFSIFGMPQDARGIERYERLGADRGIFWVPSAPAEELRPVLLACADLARRFQ